MERRVMNIIRAFVSSERKFHLPQYTWRLVGSPSLSLAVTSSPHTIAMTSLSTTTLPPPRSPDPDGHPRGDDCLPLHPLKPTSPLPQTPLPIQTTPNHHHNARIHLLHRAPLPSRPPPPQLHPAPLSRPAPGSPRRRTPPRSPPPQRTRPGRDNGGDEELRQKYALRRA